MRLGQTVLICGTWDRLAQSDYRGYFVEQEHGYEWVDGLGRVLSAGPPGPGGISHLTQR